MNPTEVLEQLQFTIENDGRMPQSMNYLLKESAFSAEDANIKLPIMEIKQLSTDELDVFNTDLVRYITDDSGNQIGRVYEAEYELSYQLDILTVAQSRYDREDLGQQLWEILYPFTNNGPDEPFIDSNGDEAEDIWEFRIDSQEPVDDFTTTPTLRRWRIEGVVRAVNRFETDDEFIKRVSVPKA